MTEQTSVPMTLRIPPALLSRLDEYVARTSDAYDKRSRNAAILILVDRGISEAMRKVRAKRRASA